MLWNIESDAQDQFENKDEKYILSIYLIGHNIGPSVVYNYIHQKISMLSHVKHHRLE